MLGTTLLLTMTFAAISGLAPRAAPTVRSLAEPGGLPRPTVKTGDLGGIVVDAAADLPRGLRELLVSKPSPWLVKVHDVGGPTDFHRDIPWHLLDKERDPRFQLTHPDALGVFNTTADVSFLIGLAAGDEPIKFDQPRQYTDHLANLAVQELELDGLKVRVAFLPAASDTLLTIVQAHNPAETSKTLRVVAACTKPPVEGPPPDRYGYGITPTTGRLEWVGYNDPNAALVASFEEWGPPAKPRQLGSLICTIAGNLAPLAHRPSPESVTQAAEAGLAGGELEYRLEARPRATGTLLIGFNVHRFGPQPLETPNDILLYPQETPKEVLHYAVRTSIDALAADWPRMIAESFAWYRRVPVFDLPEKSWSAGLICAMELPRGNTWSAQDVLRQPFYSLCRVHGHEPYRWWSYGMHAHEHLTTFVVNLTEPGLSQNFLRGHLQVQQPDGRIPYGVNHRGHNAQHDQGLATCPILCWEAWGTYAWSQDRTFLEQAYEAGARSVRWWRSPARTRGEVGLQHWMDYIETVRDDADLATWTATGKAQNQEALDLNCYLLNEERTLAAMARELGREDDANSWDADADRRAELMRRHLWHEQDRVFYGRDLLTGTWADVMDISTFLPLWCGLASQEQAARLVKLLHDPQTFGTDYPVATLAVRHMPEKRKGEWHWRGSNWVEMSWLVVLGLKRYGFYEEAARVAEANCRMVFRTLEKTGHFREFYNTFTGEPTDLTDYIWASIPAAMVVDLFFGLRPTAEGLEILPALPKSWEHAAMKNLHVRNSRISVQVRRDPTAKQTTVRVNGAPRAAHENRGLTIPWLHLLSEAHIEITHPPQ